MNITTLNKDALPTCDNDCTNMGWTEFLGYSDRDDIHISVAPNQDMTDVLTAFCHDDQEMIRVNGWMFIFEKIEA